ncbi:MAG: tetratricopeptide repeat protein [Chloroflexi bacterium]|nr:tetratricopeptide repeat protein [Chloroflexota bacterium]
MAALKSRDGPAGQLVLQSPLLPRLSSLVSTLVWIGFLAVFILPSFGNVTANWETILIAGIVLVVVVGVVSLNSIVTTQIVLDPVSRVITISRRLLGLPIQTREVPFADVTNIEYQYYRQQSGRYAHDAWRVNAVTKQGTQVGLNWDGKKDEMSGLAQRAADMTRAELVDNSTKPVSTVQQILDTVRDRMPENAPGPAAAPDQGNPPTLAGTLPADTSMMPDVTPSAPGSPPTSMGGPSGPTEPYQGREVQQPALPGAPMPPISSPPMEGPPPVDTTPAASDLRRLSRQELEQRVASDPMDTEARYALAGLYQTSGQLDRAIGLYQETIRLDPSNAEAQNDLGVALWQRGKKSEAEAAFRRAVALDPYSSTAHLNLGLFLKNSKQVAEASQEFYQARRNARTRAEEQAAEAASTGTKMEPRLAGK